MGKHITFKEHTSFLVKLKKVRNTINTINNKAVVGNSDEIVDNKNDEFNANDAVNIIDDIIESINDNTIVILNNFDNIAINAENITQKLGIKQASHDQLAIDNLIVAVNKLIHDKNSLLTKMGKYVTFKEHTTFMVGMKKSAKQQQLLP